MKITIRSESTRNKSFRERASARRRSATARLTRSVRPARPVADKPKKEFEVIPKAKLNKALKPFLDGKKQIQKEFDKIDKLIESLYSATTEDKYADLAVRIEDSVESIYDTLRQVQDHFNLNESIYDILEGS